MIELVIFPSYNLKIEKKFTNNEYICLCFLASRELQTKKPPIPIQPKTSAKQMWLTNPQPQPPKSKLDVLIIHFYHNNWYKRYIVYIIIILIIINLKN